MPISNPDLWQRLATWQDQTGGQQVNRLLANTLDIHPKNRPFVRRAFLCRVYREKLKSGSGL